MKSITVLGLLGLATLAFMPFAAAAPLIASLTWSSQSITMGATTTGTVNISSDSDCPSSGTYSGTLSVVEPDGISTGTTVVTLQPCGVDLSLVYPSGFAGAASTTTCGTYSAKWAGTTSALIGGTHPTFKLTDNFVVNCDNHNVPEFSAPVILVAAVGMLALAGAKSWSRSRSSSR